MVHVFEVVNVVAGYTIPELDCVYRSSVAASVIPPFAARVSQVSDSPMAHTRAPQATLPPRPRSFSLGGAGT